MSRRHVHTYEVYCRCTHVGTAPHRIGIVIVEEEKRKKLSVVPPSTRVGLPCE